MVSAAWNRQNWGWAITHNHSFFNPLTDQVSTWILGCCCCTYLRDTLSNRLSPVHLSLPEFLPQSLICPNSQSILLFHKADVHSVSIHLKNACSWTPKSCPYFFETSSGCPAHYQEQALILQLSRFGRSKLVEPLVVFLDFFYREVANSVWLQQAHTFGRSISDGSSARPKNLTGFSRASWLSPGFSRFGTICDWASGFLFSGFLRRSPDWYFDDVLLSMSLSTRSCSISCFQFLERRL